MAYSPYLPGKYSSTLRRIAWARNEPMTRTIQIVIEEYSKSVEQEQICKSCRDKTKCDHCVFNNRKNSNQNQQ
jgi:hypothetical protein